MYAYVIYFYNVKNLLNTILTFFIDVCVLECPQGYAEDKNGNKLCECAKKSHCPPMTNCKKNCPHGFRLNKSGCPQCKCDSCKPLTGCSKKCPHGLMTNHNNCPICKCLCK